MAHPNHSPSTKALRRIQASLNRRHIRPSVVQHHAVGGEVFLTSISGSRLLKLWVSNGPQDSIERNQCSRVDSCCSGQVFISLVKSWYASSGWELIPLCQSCMDTFQQSPLKIKPFSQGVSLGSASFWRGQAKQESWHRVWDQGSGSSFFEIRQCPEETSFTAHNRTVFFLKRMLFLHAHPSPRSGYGGDSHKGFPTDANPRRRALFEEFSSGRSADPIVHEGFHTIG
jgi:hypothetical protein